MTNNSLSCSTLGAIAEYKACIWLMKQGYEVYRNVSPNGKFDIIAYKPGDIRKIDVTTYSSLSYKHCNRKKTNKAKSLDGYVLYSLPDDTFRWHYEQEDNFINYECIVCKKLFQSAYKNRITCGDEICKMTRQRSLLSKKPHVDNSIS